VFCGTDMSDEIISEVIAGEIRPALPHASIVNRLIDRGPEIAEGARRFR
jgi:hypothetical protein